MKKLVSLVLIPMLILSNLLQVVSAEDIPWGETQTVDITAAADTYVSSKIGETSKSFEGSQELWVSGVSTAKYSTYMVINANDWQVARLDSAKLKLFGLSVKSGSLKVYRIDDKIYDPSSVTYLKKPSETGKQLIGTIPLTVGGSYCWSEFDVTSALNAEPDKILSLCIESTDVNIYKFASTENADPTYAPRITLTGAKPNGGIPVENVSLSKNSLTFINNIDSGVNLTATVYPPYATNKNVTWTSSDESVATVVAGFVKPINLGTAYITATSVADPFKYAQCMVNVISPEEAGVFNSTKITSDDCYISEYPQGWPGNHGSDTDLPMRSHDNSQSRQIYTKFQFPDIAGYEILSAKVYMYCTKSMLDNVPVTPWGVFGNDTWSEMTVTEAAGKKPEDSGSMIEYKNSITRVNEINRWYSWDVTQYANEKGNGIYSLKFYVDYNTQPINGIYLDQVDFSSKEGSYAPYMEIVARPYTVNSNSTSTVVSAKQTNQDTANSMPAVLMAANYNINGVMGNINAINKTILPLSSQDLSVTLPPLPCLPGDYTKFFLWDDLKTARPYRISQKYWAGDPEYQPSPVENNGISVIGNKLTLKGKAASGSLVGFSLFYPGMYDTNLNYDNVMSSVLQVDQTVSDNDGNFEFTYNIPDGIDEGIYTAVVSDQDTVGLISPMTFKYIKPENLNDSRLRLELTNATTPLELQQILNQYAKALNIDTSKLFTKYYAELDDNTKNNLLNQMLNKFDSDTTTPTSKIIFDTIGLSCISKTDNYVEMSDFLNDCMSELGISASNISKLNSNADLMRYVSQQLYGKQFSSIEEFANQVNNSINKFQEQLIMPNIFMDNMILQADKPINVWGNAGYNKAISLTLSDGTKTYTASTKADSNNNFSATFSSVIPAGYTSYTLTISDGVSTITYNNILFGDVYLLAGESNMAMTMNDYAKIDYIGNDIDTANNNNIRYMSTLNDGSINNEEDVLINTPWQAITPITVGNLSAIGYYYAKEIQQLQNIPIGIISAAAVGSTSNDWMENGKSYNNHIYPFKDWHLKGILWYQGESDEDNCSDYDTRCISIIDHYRNLFNDESLPFCTIGLAKNTNNEIQNLQLKTFEHYENIAGVLTKNTVGYISTVDLPAGSGYKNIIGIRTAKWSKSVVYGEGGESCGPTIQNVWINDGYITVLFNHVGDGLETNDGSNTVKLHIFGNRNDEYDMDATINGGNKLTTLSRISSIPINVSYGEYNLSQYNTNLMNSDGFAATPFNIDDIESNATTGTALADNNGNDTIHIMPGGKVNAVSIHNGYKQAGKVIVGIYEEGKLVALSVKSVNSYNFTQYGDAIINIDLSIPNNIEPDKAILKAIYVDSLNTVSPITKVYIQK